MSFAHAGLGVVTGLPPDTVYSVVEFGTATPATLYTDEDKDAETSPSVAVSGGGVAVFYAAPGNYDLYPVSPAPGQFPGPVSVVVGVNPLDVIEGTGTINDLTSGDDSIDITDPTGPSSDLRVAKPYPGASSITREFPFAYDLAGLAEGTDVLYTPTAGDLLLDAWITVTTAWDGTTPLADIMAAAGGFLNFLGALYSGNWFDMTKVGGPLSANVLPSLLAQSGTAGTIRAVPYKFAADDTIGVVVSQTGQPGGGDPGATHGAAVLYLVTATPA
jgi:hypothetical protein